MKYYLLPLLSILGSCSSAIPNVDPSVTYRPNMTMKVGDTEYIGAVVLPHPAMALPVMGVSSGTRDKSSIVFELSGHGKFDLFTAETCAREDFAEKLGSSTEYSYSPTALEADYCPLEFSGFDQKGRHSFGFIDFQDDTAQLRGTLDCNAQHQVWPGVSVCVIKAGKELQLHFDEKVVFDPDANCKFENMSPDNGVVWFTAMPGKCVYAFHGIISGMTHRLTVIGYQKILMEQQ